MFGRYKKTVKDKQINRRVIITFDETHFSKKGIKKIEETLYEITGDYYNIDTMEMTCPVGSFIHNGDNFIIEYEWREELE